MVENLSKEQLQGILETIPVEISFVDDNDLIQFWNKHETRIFKRPVSVLGKSVQNCHPKHSVDKLDHMLSDSNNVKRDSVEFGIDHGERKVCIRYIAPRGKQIGIWIHWKPPRYHGNKED